MQQVWNDLLNYCLLEHLLNRVQLLSLFVCLFSTKYPEMRKRQQMMFINCLIQVIMTQVCLMTVVCRV